MWKCCGGVQEQQAPEVCRTPLEQLCLTVKTRFGTDHKLTNVLSQMLTPPEVTAVVSAVRSLTSLGALDAAEALTPLGRLLSQIPMDPRLAKTCIFACMLRSVFSTRLALVSRQWHLLHGACVCASVMFTQCGELTPFLPVTTTRYL